MKQSRVSFEDVLRCDTNLWLKNKPCDIGASAKPTQMILLGPSRGMNSIFIFFKMSQKNLFLNGDTMLEFIRKFWYEC